MDIEQIKQAIMAAMGRGQQPQPQATPEPPALNEAEPWNSPSLVPPPGPRPQIMGAQAEPPAPEPPPDPIGSQVRELMRQREIAQRLVPERMWNR
jgi:hypothetical protein